MAWSPKRSPTKRAEFQRQGACISRAAAQRGSDPPSERVTAARAPVEPASPVQWVRPPSGGKPRQRRRGGQTQYASRSGRISCKMVVAISSIDLVVVDSHRMPSRRIMASASDTSMRQLSKLA